MRSCVKGRLFENVKEDGRVGGKGIAESGYFD